MITGDKIECQVCKKPFNQITLSHLKSHNLTIAQYKMKYPNVPISSNLLKEHASTIMKLQWQDSKSSYNSQEYRAILSKLSTGEGNPFWGKHHTDEEKASRSQTLKNFWKLPSFRQKMVNRRNTNLFESGENNPMFGKFGESNPFYGHLHTKESKQKAVKNRRNYDGSNNPNWKDGTAYEPYDWRFNDALKKQVRDRDHHTCQLCGILEVELSQKLAVHHTDYNKFHSTSDNLISLCGRCNSSVNGDREYWKTYFQQLIIRRNINNESPVGV